MTTTAPAPLNLAGRIDELLNDAHRLLRSDTEARDLYLFAREAWAAREQARIMGKRPPAPMSWLPKLEEIADWIGFR